MMRVLSADAMIIRYWTAILGGLEYIMAGLEYTLARLEYTLTGVEYTLTGVEYMCGCLFLYVSGSDSLAMGAPSTY